MLIFKRADKIEINYNKVGSRGQKITPTVNKWDGKKKKLFLILFKKKRNVLND